MEGEESLRGYQIFPSALGQHQIYQHNTWQVTKGSKTVPNSSIPQPQPVPAQESAEQSAQTELRQVSG